MRIEGVEVLAVDLWGRVRFKPQSPRAREDCVVSMVAWVGYGSVAVSESNSEVAVG